MRQAVLSYDKVLSLKANRFDIVEAEELFKKDNIAKNNQIKMEIEKLSLKIDNSLD